MEKCKNILFKSLDIKNELEDVGSVLAEYVGVRDSYDDFKIYKAIAYTTKRDRDGDKATIDFLYQMADKVVGLIVIKNHKWNSVEDTVGRVISAEVVDFEEVHKALVIRFYACEPDDIRRIDNGLYYGISMGFNAKSVEDAEGWSLVSCDDVYEVSLVSVPAVPDAHIIKSLKEGEIPVNEVDKLKAEIETINTTLKSVQDENDKLRAENTELAEKLANIEAKEFEDEASDVLNKTVADAVDEMEPSSDEVKGYMVDEIKTCGYEACDADADGAIQLKSGKFIVLKNFEAMSESVKTKYSKLGLLGKKPVVEKVETPVVETKSAKTNPSVRFTNEAQRKEFENMTVVKSTVSIN